MVRNSYLQFICKTIANCIWSVYDGSTMRFLGKYYRKHGHCRNRVIVGLLLLAYGSAGVLGYGLHAVWDCGHDHGHSHQNVCAHSHSHEHHHHGHGCHHHQEPMLAAKVADANGSLSAAAEDCPICAFLVQAQSPIVLELATACVGPTATILSIGETSHPAPLLGAHLARGPPLG